MASKANQPSNVAPPPSPSGSSDDSLARVFGDPDLVRSAGEDPVLRFILTWWRQMTVAVLAVLAVFYATSVFRETRQRDLQSSGDAFFKVQREFETFQQIQSQLAARLKMQGANPSEQDKVITGELEKNRDASRKKLDDALTALSDMRAPFDRLAQLYRGLVARESGEGTAFLQGFNPRAWIEIKDASSNERFFAELEALAYARTLLDSSQLDSSQPTAKPGEGLALLKELGSQGAYVHTSAALSVAALANTPEERAAALELLSKVQSAHPEQTALLEDEISRLK